MTYNVSHIQNKVQIPAMSRLYYWGAKVADLNVSATMVRRGIQNLPPRVTDEGPQRIKGAQKEWPSSLTNADLPSNAPSLNDSKLSKNNKLSYFCTLGICHVSLIMVLLDRKPLYSNAGNRMQCLCEPSYSNSLYSWPWRFELHEVKKQQKKHKGYNAGIILSLFQTRRLLQYLFFFFPYCVFGHTHIFPATPASFLYRPFVIQMLLHVRHMLWQGRGLWGASDQWSLPLSSFTGKNDSQIILECMNRNCLFHFTANLWQMFWGGSHSQ